MSYSTLLSISSSQLILGLSNDTLGTLGEEVETIMILKSATGWHLEALEDATREIQPDSDDEDEGPDTTRPSLM